MKNNNWRKKILARLDDLKPYIKTSITNEELEQMYQIADKFDPHIEEIPKDLPIIEVETAKISPSVRLLTATCSYVQQCNNSDVPYHLQIVVPETTGTAAANKKQLYEIAVWERSLVQIFYEFDVGCVFFEYCNCNPPLFIDVFVAPTDETSPLYWKSALEETCSEQNPKIVQLHTRSCANVFLADHSYIAVSFDEGNGLGKVWDSLENPRTLAIEVVASMWQDSQVKPPKGIIEAIKTSNSWPK